VFEDVVVGSDADDAVDLPASRKLREAAPVSSLMIGPYHFRYCWLSGTIDSVTTYFEVILAASLSLLDQLGPRTRIDVGLVRA
jgi:hypothetical protein